MKSAAAAGLEGPKWRPETDWRQTGENFFYYICGLIVGKPMRLQDMNAGPMEVPSRLQILMGPWVYVVNFLRSPWIETAFLCFTNGRTKTQTPNDPFKISSCLWGQPRVHIQESCQAALLL